MLNQAHYHHTNYGVNTQHCLQWTFLRNNHNIKLRVYSRSRQVSIKILFILKGERLFMA